MYLKTETKGDDIREEIKYNTIRTISVQRKALKGYAEKLKNVFTYALKETNDWNLDHKKEKDQLFNLQEQMGRIILMIATLKISVHLNIQWLR